MSGEDAARRKAPGTPAGTTPAPSSGTEPGAGRPYVEDKVGTQSGNPNMHAGEQAHRIEGGLAVQLPERLARVRDRLVEAFGELEVLGFRGELTLVVPAERIVDVLRFCRDDPALRCEYLMELSAVHWPAGKRVENAQETTGWPAYELGDERGWVEVDYLLRSLEHGHRFRLRVNVDDEWTADGHETGHVPSASGVYASAIWMEREAYDFFGVVFDDHPNLTRIHMPDGWEGHPQRKDYPLGGIEVQYKGATIPPPDERSY